MKAPISWLKEYVDIDVDVQTLCDKMVGIGFEIEEKIYLGDKFSNVVVGKIVSISKHPDADKLSVCQVNVGKDELLQVITAATNVFEGAVVPVALNGAKLADGTIIKNGKLRGLASNGMFCGGDELGITTAIYPGADVYGILILDSKEQIGQDMKQVLGLDDWVLDFSVTFNRPDCNSIYGLAREVAVALGKKVKPIDVSFVENSKFSTEKLVSVSVKDSDLCPNYYMQGVTDISIAPSPLWMSRRLAACGLNSINNIVDITNYVLLEVGQPMHAFDHDNLKDNTIIVRRAKQSEKIVPFDNKEYTLNSDILVIADKDKPVGLAGIMGGQNSGVQSTTTTVVFESAKFIRENIRRSGRTLGIRSDSSSRFEKGVDAYSARLALSRALHLVQSLSCGKISIGRISIENKVDAKKQIAFDFSRIKNLLGIEISREKVLTILSNLGITSKIENGVISCDIPLFREDLERDCDIIEEIIRVYGYDNIQSTLFENTKITSPTTNVHQNAIDKTLSVLKGLGYNQCITYSFGGSLLYNKLSTNNSYDTSKNVRILNPLGEEYAFLRTTIAAHLLDIAATNLNRKNKDLKLFEISKTFFPTEKDCQPIEKYKVCMVTTVGDFYNIKNDVDLLLTSFGINAKYIKSENPILHNGVSADILAGDSVLGFVGELHPLIKNNFDLTQKTYICELLFDEVISSANTTIKYKPIPKLPSVERDLALLVDKSLQVQTLIDATKNASPMCESVELFDIYESQQLGDDKKSVALSLNFRVSNRTLSDKDIEPQVKRILRVLEEKFGAKLRQ